MGAVKLLGVATEWQPEWVAPFLAQVCDLDLLAYGRSAGNEHTCDVSRAKGICAAISWVRGATRLGPATGRPDWPLTRPIVTAEMWAAMALNDGGGTSERTLRGVCVAEGVRYYRPDFEGATLDHGTGIYQTLGWLIANADGWRGGRTPPLEIPERDGDGNLADDPRSRELAAQIERIRIDEAAEIARRC